MDSPQTQKSKVWWVPRILCQNGNDQSGQIASPQTPKPKVRWVPSFLYRNRNDQSVRIASQRAPRILYRQSQSAPGRIRGLRKGNGECLARIGSRTQWHMAGNASGGYF